MKDETILQIARCEEVGKARTDEKHPCRTVVCSQLADTFQIPEPYNGHIEKAEILFVSVNPKIDPKANEQGHEIYPTEKWENKDLYGFFETRFDTIPKFDYNKQRYWYLVNQYTEWILEQNGNNLLKDHAALTEIVHCKSVRADKKSGVENCCEKCIELWLEKVLAEFNGKYIVLFTDLVGKYYDCIKKLYPNKIVIRMPFPSRDRRKNAERKKDIFEQIEKQS